MSGPADERYGQFLNFVGMAADMAKSMASPCARQNRNPATRVFMGTESLDSTLLGSVNSAKASDFQPPSLMISR
jgi:hypothetical protein